MTRMQMLIEQVRATRAYTEAVLSHVPDEMWFRMPAGGVTHVGWQVGHLVCAQYSHFVERVCGEREEDKALYPRERWDKLFHKGTVPVEEAGVYPAVAEIRQYFASVFEACVKRLAGVKEEELDLPILRPHGYAKTRGDMLMWWIRHEAMHTGHIGLIRRGLGMEPWR